MGDDAKPGMFEIFIEQHVRKRETRRCLKMCTDFLGMRTKL